MLTFKPKEHKYYWNGEEVPSVTGILSGLVDYSHVTDEDREFGTLVHEAAVKLDLGRCTVKDFTEPMHSRMVAFQSFKRDYKLDFAPDMIEVRLYHPLYKYAGTADRIMPGLLIDIKSGPLNDVCGYQLSGYTEAYKHQDSLEFQGGMRRWGVQLKANGKYAIRKYQGTRDFNIFLNQLSKGRKENER